MKLKDKMMKLHLSPKSEYLKLFTVGIGIILAGLAISFVMKSFLYIGFGVTFAFIFALLFLSRYGTQLDKINKENLDEFVILFSYFRIFIHNGYNVYTALKEISYFANDNLKEMLDKLVSDIDKDKTVRPFVDFSSNFNEILVEEMMISIYQVIDDGEQSNYLDQFEMIFDKFSDIVSEKNLKDKDTSLGSLTSAPLVGSCFLIIIITVGIISVLGELMNVI